MILFFSGWYTPALVATYPDRVFVFGDNSLGVGLGGQAAIRGLENTLGVPTKWAPHRGEPAFYSDEFFDRPLITARLGQLMHLLARGTDVVVPGRFDAIELGTGLAELPDRAPQLYLGLSASIQKAAIHFGHEDWIGEALTYAG